MDSSSPPAVELRTRVRQQEVVADLGQQALATDDLDQLMHDAAAAVAETLDVEYAKVLELLPGGEEVLLRQGVGWRDGLVGTTTVPTDLDSQAGYTLLSEEPVIVEDLHTEKRFSGPELLTSHDVVSGISVVIGSVENPWGVLGTHDTEHREFTENDATFVQSVANILASVIERVERERELQRTERHFQAVFEDPNILVGLLAPDGTVLDINETALEYIDADLETVTGEPLWETPWWGEDDAIRNDVREWIERAAAGEYVDFEADLTRPSGQQYTVSGYFRPVTDDDGEVVSIIISDRDVTERKQRERELSESERRYRTLAENFPNGGVGVYDEDLRYTLVTGTMWDDIEPDAEDLEGETIWEALPPETADDVEPVFRKALDGEAGSVVSQLEGRTYRVWATPLRDADGEITGGQSFALNITDQLERERELAESERRYRTLAEYFPNGIVTLFDQNLRYELAAGRAFDDIPVEPSDVEGHHFTEVWDEATAEALRPAFEAALDGEEQSVELAYVGRDWVVHAVPITDEHGDVFAGMTMAQDITERKEREQALEESERRYRTLAENFPNGAVGLFNEDLEYTALGGQLLDASGVDPEDLLGSSVSELYPEELVEEIEPYFHAALEGEANLFETEYHDRHLLAHTIPVQNADDVVFGGMIVVQDVTERREYERRLEKSNERLEQFAYAASHDLQEPLRMVSSYLQLLDRRYADALDEDGRDFIEFAVDGADRMREIINGLLEYSRIDSRGDPFEPVDLDDVLADVRDNLRVKIEESDATITVGDLPTVEGDNGQLRQVFQNLLDNAIEYSGDEPPRVYVGAERLDGQWKISVRDEGVGIDPEDADRVFEVFQSLHGHDESGTGIGLALVERVIERHGGDVWVDSPPGEGATFSLTLPVVDDSTGRPQQ